MVKACLNGLFVQWPVIFPLPNTINDHYASPSSGWNSTHPTHCVSTLCRCATLITEKNSISNLNFPLETKAYVSCRFSMLISSAGHKKKTKLLVSNWIEQEKCFFVWIQGFRNYLSVHRFHENVVPMQSELVLQNEYLFIYLFFLNSSFNKIRGRRSNSIALLIN